MLAVKNIREGNNAEALEFLHKGKALAENN